MGVCYVSNIPREKNVHSVKSRHSDMKRITVSLHGNQSGIKNLARKHFALRCNRQQRNSLQQVQPALCRRRITIGGLLESHE